MPRVEKNAMVTPPDDLRYNASCGKSVLALCMRWKVDV